jgi:hypothetical protein
MSEALRAFHEEFFQEVLRDADADGRWAEDAFFELFCDQLVEAGELETHDRARYVSPRGIRIDGYGGDPATTDGALTLIVADFNQAVDIETLTATEMDSIFKRATTFLRRALEPNFRTSLDETSAGFGLATFIADSWAIVSRIRIVLISNRELSNRVDGRESGELDGRKISYSVWDLGRLQRYAQSGRSREDMVVDLAEYGAPVPALRAQLTKAGYEAYLLVMPGVQLASIYDRWGARLLEQNVRVFLQAKNNVNKGIRNTLENDSEMFFAYNNGITATAEEVITSNDRGALVVTGIRNLQIVNGGQTTASVYSASRKKDVDLGRVFVQMKLSVIPPERSEEVVPKISEYANSQNKVNAADFFANHPFHLRFKDFSEKVYAPSRDGTFRESKWFYERARGQYQDVRSGLSAAALKKLELEYPKKQLITKTDLAKYLAVWDGLPHIVSTGAQKNFAQFAERVGKEWSEHSDHFNEASFREAIAKAIIFKATETIVSGRPWYDGAYRANIVAYAIAKLAADVKKKGKGINFDVVWRAQQVPEVLKEALTISADSVRLTIAEPPTGFVQNVTEWAKKVACWQRVEALEVKWPNELRSTLLDWDDLKRNSAEGVKEQKMLNGIQAQTLVVNAGPILWKKVRDWALEHRVLGLKELEILAVASTPGKIPSEKQSLIVVEALKKARAEGCPFGPE